MAKHHKTDKTLVEKMLDKAGIAYVPYEFPTEEVGDVAQLTVLMFRNTRFIKPWY